MTKLYVTSPDEVAGMHFHGQWVLDCYPGAVLNFEADDAAEVREWADKLATFLAGSDDYLEFSSPHLPGTYFLSRAGATHVVATTCAWSQKVKPRSSGDNQLVDAATGIPLLRRG